ncbi:MAG: CRISPR-associated endonuclease Cas2 [Methanomicrobiales archaeon]
MLTLVIYDISDNSVRNRLIKRLQHYGLHRIQKSGFLGNISLDDRKLLEEKLDNFLSSDNDSIYVVPLCDRCKDSTSIFSREVRYLENTHKFRIV